MPPCSSITLFTIRTFTLSFKHHNKWCEVETCEQMMCSSNTVHKSQQQHESLVQYTPPFALTSRYLPFTIYHLPFTISHLDCSGLEQVTGKTKSFSYLQQCLSIAVPQGNAAAVMGSMGSTTSPFDFFPWLGFLFGGHMPPLHYYYYYY